jgi:hypothetical protein
MEVFCLSCFRMEAFYFSCFRKRIHKLIYVVFLFFMTSCGYMAPIVALDYERMRNCNYLKDGNFATRRFLVGFWSK